MDAYFSMLSTDKIKLLTDHTLFKKMSNSDIRSLRHDIKNNNELRDKINNGDVCIDTLLKMPYTERANETIKKKRLEEQNTNKRQCIMRINKYTEEELKNILNIIDDP